MNVFMSFAEAVSRTLWALSWQVAVLVLLVWAAAAFFRKASPNFRYCLWCTVLLRLCVPAVLALPGGIGGDLRDAVEFSAPRMLLAAQQTVGGVPPVLSNAAVIPAPTAAPVAPLRQQRPVSPGAVVGLVWLAVSLALVAIIVGRNLWVHRLVRSLPVTGRTELLQLTDALCARCRVRRAVRVRTGGKQHPGIGPAVFGVLRPTIVLPTAIAERWPLDDIEPVLLHELAHIRRRDLLLNWVQMVVQAFYFFHPLVWLANARIRHERELACDDLAVMHLRGQGPRYSRSFVRVIEDASDTAALQWVAAGMTERYKPLTRRIVRVMGKDYRRYQPLGLVSILLLVFLSATAIVVAGEHAVPADTDARQSASAHPTGKASIGGRLVRGLPDGGEKPMGGEEMTLMWLNATDKTTTKVAKDGSWEFTDLPSGTYYITGSPVKNKNGRLFDVGADDHFKGILLKYWPPEKGGQGFLDWRNDDQIPCQLTLEERHRAEEAFSAQRDNWLAVRRVSANYRWTTRTLENGDWVEKDARTGKIALQMIPLSREEAKKLGHGLELQLQYSAYDNETKWHGAADDIVSGTGRMVYWQDGHETEKSNKAPEKGMLTLPNLSMVYTEMAMGYKDEKWSGAHYTREEYFKGIAPPIRFSTDEETQRLLGGEKCFLFLPWAAHPSVWISAQTGELRRMEMWDYGNVGGTAYRYENYIEDTATKLRFPSKIMCVTLKGEGAKKTGSEVTVEMTDLRINPELPPETFQVK